MYSISFWSYSLQSSSNRKIDLYSKHRENKVQALPKADVMYEWSEVGTQILPHHVRHELRNGLLGKLFLLLPCITINKVGKSMKKHWLRTTASTSREQTAITYNSLGSLQPNKDFRAPLAWVNTMIPRFNRWPLPSPRTRQVKKLTDFFQKTYNVFQCFMLKKSVLRYYVWFLQIQSPMSYHFCLFMSSTAWSKLFFVTCVYIESP